MILVIFHQLDLTLPLLPIIQILSHQLALHLHHMVLPIGDMGDPKVGDQVSLVDLGLVGLETIGGIDQQDIPDIDLRIPTKRLTIRVTLMVPKIHPQNDPAQACHHLELEQLLDLVGQHEDKIFL
jgi:hypothetical protein